LLLVLELASGGDLFDFLSFTGCFDENVARTYFHQLISGIKECHSHHIAHRDLKPENLFMDHNYVLKICDFGFSHMVEVNAGTHRMQTELGTKGYMAPEILAGSKYDESVDLFSAAVILFIMLAGFPPFQFATKQDWWYNKIMSEKFALFWKAHERSAYFTPEAKDLINKMIAFDPSKRLSIEEIEQHEWFNGPILTDEQLQEELSARAELIKLEKQKDRDSNKGKKGNLGDFLGNEADRSVFLDADGIPRFNPVLTMKPRMNENGNEGVSVEDTDNFGVMSSILPAEEKLPEMYDESVAVYTKFNTSSSPNAVLTEVIELLRKANLRYERDEFSVKTSIKGGAIVDAEEDELPQTVVPESIVFCVRVYGHPTKEGMNTVVFKRLQGPTLQFKSVFDDFVSCLSIDVIHE